MKFLAQDSGFLVMRASLSVGLFAFSLCLQLASPSLAAGSTAPVVDPRAELSDAAAAPASLDKNGSGVREGWRPAFVDGETALGGTVAAAVIWDDGSGPALYAGGAFTTAGSGGVVNHVARWNGVRWTPLGAGLFSDSPITSGVVSSMAVYGGRLIVGGVFTAAGGSSAIARLAQWDGAQWQAMPDYTGGSVRALTVHDGALIVSDGSSIFRIDPQGSQVLGTVTGDVSRLTVWNGQLVAAGSFSAIQGVAGSTNTPNLALWNGISWQSIGLGAPTGFRDLVVHQGDLVIGGGGFSVDGVPISSGQVARWNGQQWSGLGAPWAVDELASDGQQLLVGISQSSFGRVMSEVRAWNGSSWAPLGERFSGRVSFLHAIGAERLMGVDFAGFQPLELHPPAVSLATWFSGEWRSLGQALSGAIENFSGVTVYPNVRAITSYDGDLVAVGNFMRMGDRRAGSIARWDGHRWHPFGNGQADWGIEAVHVHEGKLFAGGGFTILGGVFMPGGVGVWDGVRWRPGVESPWGSCRFSAFGTFRGELMALGGCQGGATQLWRWNGSRFERVTGSPTNLGGRALVEHLDHLYIGGAEINFSAVVEWDGAFTWRQLGLNREVTSLVVHAGSLYALGRFGVDTPPGPNAQPWPSYVARWDGTAWQPVGGLSFFGPEVWLAGASFGGELYATGMFSPVQSQRFGITRWDGTSWSGVRQSVIQQSRPFFFVRAFAVQGLSLIAAGDFSREPDGLVTGQLVSLGPTADTTTSISGASTLDGSGGPVQVTFTAKVSGQAAPAAGSVTFISTPSGSCTDTSLLPVDATTVEATCTIVYRRAGPQRVVARFHGSALPTEVGHLPSSSAPFDYDVGPTVDWLFIDGVEQMIPLQAAAP